MTKQETFVIQLPFDGFYESLWSGAINSEEDSMAEHYAERERETQPEPIRLDASDFHELIFAAMSYRKTEVLVCKCVVDAIVHELKDQFDLSIALEFDEMSSPREYNFETDRLFARIDRASLAKLVRIVRRDGYKHLTKVIEQRHTSRSGFCSFYKNDRESWLAKPVSQWDHNELHTLILAAVRVLMAENGGCHSGNSDRDFWTWDVYNTVMDCDGIYHEVDSGMDWKREARQTDP